MKIILASNNKGKIRELKEIFDSLGSDFTVLSMSEFGFNINPEEDGNSFEENALIKARALMDAISKNGKDTESLCVVADDSGLCVDFLNGAPGIYSARYSGEGATDEKNNEKLLKVLQGVPDDKRGAKFVCAAVAVFADGSEIVERGEWHGFITHEPSGVNGFGYDPLFYVPELKMTSANLSQEEKNKISHRSIAFRKMADKIINYKF